MLSQGQKATRTKPVRGDVSILELVRRPNPLYAIKSASPAQRLSSGDDHRGRDGR